MHRALLLLLLACGVRPIPVDAGTLEDLDAGLADGGNVLAWPVPFVPNITITVDPTVEAGNETCAYQCSNARGQLPPVVDLCELGGAVASASGRCQGGVCAAGEVCAVDEFKFAQTYCALGGKPRAYCWASRQPDGLVTMTARVTHRLVGAILVVRVREEGTGLVAQAFTQEGTDMVDDQGRPWPLPIALTPSSGAVTVSSATLSPGAALKGRYHFVFQVPGVGPVNVDGTFIDTIR